MNEYEVNVNTVMSKMCADEKKRASKFKEILVYLMEEYCQLTGEDQQALFDRLNARYKEAHNETRI